LDWVLLVTTGIMMGCGLLMVQSASGLIADREFGDQNHYVWR
jgi:cell division protein FtsW (lipid II flippase)